jgi:hypothetical protein
VTNISQVILRVSKPWGIRKIMKKTNTLILFYFLKKRGKNEEKNIGGGRPPPFWPKSHPLWPA